MAVEQEMRNVNYSSNEFLVVSKHQNIVEFVKKIAGNNSSLQIESQIVEKKLLFSTFVFLDTSFVSLTDLEKILSVVRQYKSKIILINPFDSDKHVVSELISICSNVIPYPSDYVKGRQAFLNLLQKAHDYEKIENTLNFGNEYLQYPELEEIAGISEHIIQIKNKIIRCAKTETPVLLLGETGTGKSTIAKIIHNISERNKQHFFHLNISTIPENLADSELFGTVQGAYTDAVKREGIIKSCHKGTLFIDEIGTAPLNVQAKLLVFMDTGEFYNVGSEKTQNADVKLIFATNDNLKLKIIQGEFRKDLLFRMSGEVISLLPLRERPEDIPVIANRIAEQHGCKITGEGILKLKNYSWEGNVRQLKQCVERACNRGNPQIDSQDLEWYN